MKHGEIRNLKKVTVKISKFSLLTGDKLEIYCINCKEWIKIGGNGFMDGLFGQIACIKCGMEF